MSELYYFPDTQLLCTSEDKEKRFNVINGVWSFTLKDGVGIMSEYYGKTFTPGPFERYTRISFNEKYPMFGY